MPTISIISGIYNCEQTLPQAIESILAQTCQDWEWILCDDGSTDNTYAVAKQYADRWPERFVLLRNGNNKGLNYTLNRCLARVSGRYVARMDGDDLCSPERLAEELRVLESRPDLAIVSTDMDVFDEMGVWGKNGHPEKPQKRDFLHGTPFCHAPCMVRREALEAVGGYSEGKWLLRVEDYHLWVKLYAAGFTGENIHKPLYQMRDDRNAAARRKLRYRLNEAYVRAFAVKELGLPFWGYVFALRPVLVGLLPGFLYDWLHKHKLKQENVP